MGLHTPIRCRANESMHGAEELELHVRAEPTAGKLETGDPEVVSGRIGAKVYCCRADAQIKGRGALARAERTNAQGRTDFPLGAIQESTNGRVDAETRSDRYHELTAETIHVE